MDINLRKLTKDCNASVGDEHRNDFLIKFIYFFDISNSYETSDGVSRQEEAELKNIGTENEALSVRGTITWIADDGQQYTLNYIADENGFQPQGDHLPKLA